jgi:hypothetical protein
MAVPSESTRCPAVTQAGARCKRSGDPYCSVHRKLERGTEKPDLPGSVSLDRSGRKGPAVRAAAQHALRPA